MTFRRKPFWSHIFGFGRVRLFINSGPTEITIFSIQHICQYAGDEQSSLIIICYYLIVILLFDLSNVVQLSGGGSGLPYIIKS